MAGHSRFYHPSQAAQEVGSLVSMTTWLPIGMGYHTHAAFTVIPVVWQDPTVDISVSFLPTHVPVYIYSH